MMLLTWLTFSNLRKLPYYLSLSIHRRRGGEQVVCFDRHMAHEPHTISLVRTNCRHISRHISFGRRRSRGQRAGDGGRVSVVCRTKCTLNCPFPFSALCAAAALTWSQKRTTTHLIWIELCAHISCSTHTIYGKVQRIFLKYNNNKNTMFPAQLKCY